MLRHVLRLAAAAVAVAAAGVGVQAPAQAATCPSASGVSVVVDFHQLGGGMQTFCDSTGAGEYADQQFKDAGHQLTFVQNEPFVCEVDGAPATQCTRTPPADAYWSLWWSDGKSGTWKYAAVGVTSLKVPAGGYVGLSWQGQSSQAKPRATPAAHTTSSASPSPTTRPPSPPHPSSSPGQAPPPSSTTPPSSSSSTAAPSPASGPASSTGHSKHPRLRPSRGAKASKPDHDSESTQAGEPVAAIGKAGPGDSGGSGSGGLPGWVAPVAIAALFAATGAIALVRRRSSGGG